MTTTTTTILDTASSLSHPRAIRIYANTLIEGDMVFDVWGHTHEVGKPKVTRRHVTVRRLDDGWLDSLELNELITIVPNGHTGRQVDTWSSGSRNVYIETGRYSTVAEEAELNGQKGA